MFTIFCLLCPCGNREYPSRFQNKAVSSMLFFQMSAQVTWEGRTFWSGQAQIYPLNYLLHMGVMLTVIKVFIILFLLCLWEQGTPWQFWKQISKLSFQLSFQIYFLLVQTERCLFWKGARKGTTLWEYSQKHLVVIRDEKVSPFMKFEIILPLLCFLFGLTNTHCRTWSSMINLWIDSRTCQK